MPVDNTAVLGRVCVRNDEEVKGFTNSRSVNHSIFVDNKDMYFILFQKALESL